MFKHIIEHIHNREYDLAISKLHPLCQIDDVEVKSRAYYLLGYINTCWDYRDKKKDDAERYLNFNLNSEYPQPYAYVLYADVLEDKNIALNYLRKGMGLFPDEHRIYAKLLQLSTDKNLIVDMILEHRFHDIALLGKTIEYLISSLQWEKICLFIELIREENELDEEEDIYLSIIEAYVYLFGENPEYTKAQVIFEKVIVRDTNNRFAYVHFLGLIYAFVKLGNYSRALEYFDRLPVNSSLYDLDDGPIPMGIYIRFEEIYHRIFDSFNEMFSKDPVRKNKAHVIYALYLFEPSEAYGVYRYRKSDALALTKFLKSEFNSKVAAALYKMRCHFRQYKEAYDALWLFVKNYEDPQSEDVYLSEILVNASNAEKDEIVGQTILYLQSEDFSRIMFMENIFSGLVKKLYDEKRYGQIVSIAQYVSTREITESDMAFRCAFAYGKQNAARAIELYKELIIKEPMNSSAINNLGVQYENRDQLFDALSCYEKAVIIDSSEELYVKNLKRVKEQLKHIMEDDVLKLKKLFSVSALEGIGYTVDLCRAILSVQDSETRKILLRDIKECAVAIIAGQDKTATIMCGSIMEALLVEKITECGFEKYDISEISKKKNAIKANVSEMGLNELLYVADKEGLLDKNSYHLGHYVRDYRNVVHPAKEKRMTEGINHENVLTMWTVLRRLICELYA